MWLFDKKHPIDLTGFKDCHSHILPGVDDGVEKIEDSLLILEEYERLGISEVVFTPHIMEDVPNTPADLRRRFEEFKEAYSGPVKLHLAAEYMIDHHFEDLVAAGDLLTHGDDVHILVETSYFNRPVNLDNILFQLQSIGYEPILAHPERYMYMDMDEYTKLKDKGILFQMNIGSLTGLYGSHVVQRATYLMKNDMYDMAGTDIHRYRMLDSFKTIRLKKGQCLPMPSHI